MEIEHRTINVRAAVLDLGATDLLLGNDALSQLGKIHVNYGTAPPHVTFDDALFQNEEGNGNFEVRCSKRSISVPPVSGWGLERSSVI